jgi:hypothetical protein
MQMEYREIKTLEDVVNRRGSKLWTQMNDNSKAEKHRAKFVQDHGGAFFREGRYWTWKSEIKIKNGYWLKRVDTGEKVFFSNMAEFGLEHGLTSVKICELMNGKRKTYKGWTASELRDVNENSGRFVKLKEEPTKKEAITKAATFINTQTNEIINVLNINQFAKENNMDPQTLYKVARGKVKSYKNLKLFNPLEQYKPSSDA